MQAHTASPNHLADTTSAVYPTCIVIGCGNTLRGDDGLGPAVAHMVAAWQLPRVVAVAVHQLMPELAANLAQYERAIFVDACHAAMPAAATSASVGIAVVQPALRQTAQTHVATPAHVLALALALYGRCPPSWLVSIPAYSFAIGAPLSAAAAQQCQIALRAVRYLITSP